MRKYDELVWDLEFAFLDWRDEVVLMWAKLSVDGWATR